MTLIQAAKLPRPLRLSDTLARQIEDWIRDQGMVPGAQLPTEKLLCERFGVSRAVVREAISRLKAEGCVETRQGLGAFVAARPGQGSFRLLREAEATPDEFAEVFEMRCLVETGAAELAARRRSQTDLERLAAALAQMERALAGDVDGASADDAFHVAIATATGNGQLARFLAFMGRQFSESRQPTWDASGLRSGRAAEAQAEHRRIFEAIRAQDGEAAREAARAHLVSAARRLGVVSLEQAFPLPMASA